MLDRCAEEIAQLTRFTIDNTPQLIFWVDKQGSIVDVNQTVCRVFGYEKGELLKMKVLDIDRYLDQARFDELWGKAHQNQ